MSTSSHPGIRWFFAVALVLFAGLSARPAQAAFSVCRGDPLVWLSDGTLLQISVQISAPASLIRDVTYTLHAPLGVTIRTIVYTGGELKSKEIVRLVSDTAPGIYRIDTVARLLTGGEAKVIVRVNSKQVNDQDSGLTGDILSITLTQ